MTRLATTFAILLLLFAAATPLPGHEELRIIGTLTRAEATRIDIRKRDGKSVSVKVDRQTEVSRDGKKVEITELRSGLSVVVDAYGDAEDGSLALEIRIVPPIRQGRQ